MDAIGEVKWIPPQVLMFELHCCTLLVLDSNIYISLEREECSFSLNLVIMKSNI